MEAKKEDPSEIKRMSIPQYLRVHSRYASTFQKWDSETAIEEGLKASAIFYACVQKRAQAIAQIPWKAKQIVRNRNAEEHIERPESPLQQLLDNPNPFFSFSEMMETLSQHIDLAGNCYWSIIRAGNDNLPVELNPLYPHLIRIRPGEDRLIDKYFYTNRVGQPTEIDERDMIHIKTVNPNDFLYGMPTIQAAGRAVDIDRDSGDWQKNSLHNRGVSDYAIILDPATSDEQHARYRKLYKETQLGKNNARGPMITTKDIKVLNQSAVEMDFVATRTKVWEEIASAMGVPLPMIGVLENATLANIEVSRRIFWLDTILPLLRMIRSQLNKQLAAEFGKDWYIDYDLSNVEALREDYGKKLDAAQKLFNMGLPLAKINEILELGITEVEKIPGANTGYLPSGLIPTDLSITTTEEQSEIDKSVELAELIKLSYGEDEES